MQTNSNESKIQYWNIWDIVHAIFLILISAFILYILGLVIQDITPFQIPEQLITAINSSISTCCGTIYLLKNYPLYYSFSNIKNYNAKKLLIAGFGGGVIVSAINFPYKTIFEKQEITAKLFIDIDTGKIYVITLLLFTVVIAPVVEELFLRAGIYRIIKNKFDATWGYIVTALIFSIMHTPSIPQAIKFILSSLILTYIYEKTNSVETSILAHSLWNMTFFASIYFYDAGLISQ